MRLLLASLLLAAALPAVAAPNSDRVKFLQTKPCPSTGQVGQRCPGYNIDHAVPLCAGGSHSIENMQWLTRAEAREKSRRDALACREEHERAERARGAEKARAGGANGGGSPADAAGPGGSGGGRGASGGVSGVGGG